MRRTIAPFLLVFAVVVLGGADFRSLVRKGNSLYHRQKFEEALAFYQQAEVLEPDNLGIHYNLGNTYYRLNRHSEAISELSLATVSRNPRARVQAFYNLGNTLYRLGRLDDALNAYKLALLANPRDRQAKENFEFCLRKKQQQSQQPDSTSRPQSGSGPQQQQPSGQNEPDRQQSQSRSQAGGQLDREQAERVLQAVQNREREAQKQARRVRRQRQVERDW